MSTPITDPPAYTPESDSQDLQLLRPSSSTPPPAYTERTARKLRITSPPGAGILNASILDAAGRVLYTTSSDAKLKTTSVRRAGLCPDSDVHADVAVTDEELAQFGWDRASPRMRFGRGDNKKRKRKVKCKEWLPLADSAAAPNAQSRVLTLDDARYTITERKDGVGYVRTHLLPCGTRRSLHLHTPHFSSSAQTTQIRLASLSRAGARRRTPNRSTLMSSETPAGYQAYLTRLCSHLLCCRVGSPSATCRTASTLLRPNFMVSATFLGGVDNLFKLPWLYARLLFWSFVVILMFMAWYLSVCIGYVHRWSGRWPMRR
ncbi:hypothetical protein BJV78DRAFT_1210980 [Lactifluus subvellereus]|nr:hypothetical protein BJV78DRAFT_1210980 [Lactifluus subvellereus]